MIYDSGQSSSFVNFKQAYIMPLKLYTQHLSPVCRSVYLTAAALGLKLELVSVDVWKKEQFSQSFLKINPQHTIPTLDDDGTIVCESNAINMYLVSKCGKNDSLYPRDLKIQSVINQRLFYNTGVVFPKLRKLVLKVVKNNPLDAADYIAIDKLYEMLEKYLEASLWIGCNFVTIADFAILPCILCYMEFKAVDGTKYPKLLKWIQNSEKLSYFHVMEDGIKDYRRLIGRPLKSSL